jgi:hypothetical protein
MACSVQGRPKTARHVKSNVKSMFIIFFNIKGIVHKEFALVGRAANSIYTVTFYGDCVKVCEDFAQNFGDKRTGCCITATLHLTLSFSPGNF